jgi:hypothetical protein
MRQMNDSLKLLANRMAINKFISQGSKKKISKFLTNKTIQ